MNDAQGNPITLKSASVTIKFRSSTGFSSDTTFSSKLGTPEGVVIEAMGELFALAEYGGFKDRAYELVRLLKAADEAEAES